MAQTPGAERPGTERTRRPGTERTSTQNDFRLAVADSSVVMLGIAVLGLGLGIILNAHGLPIWTAPLLSALVFAGSVEFLMVGMVSGGAPLAFDCVDGVPGECAPPGVRSFLPVAQCEGFLG